MSTIRVESSSSQKLSARLKWSNFFTSPSWAFARPKNFDSGFSEPSRVGWFFFLSGLPWLLFFFADLKGSICCLEKAEFCLLKLTFICYLFFRFFKLKAGELVRARPVSPKWARPEPRLGCSEPRAGPQVARAVELFWHP